MVRAMYIFFLLAAATGIMGFGELSPDYSDAAKMLSGFFIILYAFSILGDLYLQLEKKK